MAKQVLNIIDFSGGINKAVDKRDIEPNQSVDMNGLISYNPGKLTSKGALNEIPGLIQNIGSFPDGYISEGIRNLYGIFPEFGFRIFGKAVCSAVSGGVGTFAVVPTNSHHSLDVGAKLTIIKSDSYLSTIFRDSAVGDTLIVSSIINDTSFYASGADNLSGSNEVFYYALNVNYNEKSSLLSEPIVGYKANRFFLKANQYGKFGFYSLGDDRYWYGRTEDNITNAFGNDPWFFDTKYLWDWNQDSGNTVLEQGIFQTKVHDAFYEDGVFRLLVDAPKAFRDGHCKRPVGLYSIGSVKKKFDQTNELTTYNVQKGWYALRSHCLSPQEYHYTTQYNSTIPTQSGHYYEGGGAINADTDATSVISSWSIPDPSSDDEIFSAYNSESLLLAHQFSVGVGHASNALSGDWQFASGGEHDQIGLGVSFLYDDINNPSESNISLLKRANGAEAVPMTGDSAENDKALYLYYKVFVGKENLLEDQQQISAGNIGGLSGINSVAEFRGSGMNNGYSNFGQWNPRIVGANLWLTWNGDGEIDDPLFLATINFNYDSDTYGLSVSHDGIEATTKWASANDPANGVVHQIIAGIPSVPTLKYSLKNGYKYNENIHAWYKTSAIVNRRLYAGNVSYYDKNVNDINKDEAPSHFPDRVLRSLVNKFDILPQSSFLDIVLHDGQDIVKLVSFNQKLLIFKQNDLFVVDCSGEFELLEATYRGMGIINPTSVCVTPSAIYWLNSQGIYGLDAENPPANIIKSKIATEEWIQKIWNIYSHLEYDPQDNLLILFTRYKDNPDDNYIGNHIILIDVKNGSVFYKSNPGINTSSVYSSSVVTNNKMYVASSSSTSDTETFNAQNYTLGGVGTKASCKVEFQINNSSHNNSLGGANNLHLLLNIKGSGSGTWTKINNTPFAETANIIDDSAAGSNFVKTYMNILSGNLNNEQYNYYIWYEVDSDRFIAEVISKNTGDTLTLVNEEKTGYGSTPFAFSSDDTEGNIRIGDITNFAVINNTAGVTPTEPIWQIYGYRGTSFDEGVKYTMVVHYGVNLGNDIYESRTVQATYVTSKDPSLLYNGSDYVDDCGATETAVSRSDKLTANIKHFLVNNSIGSEGQSINLTDYFTFGSITNDSDGSITGNSNQDYFTMTLDKESSWFGYEDITIDGIVSGGTGGSILRWESDKTSTANKVNLETKDNDFGQPNVRKKVYKAYITYKASAQLSVSYQANQSGTWTLGTVTDETTAGYLDATASAGTGAYSRAEVKFDSGTNNIYSFALKITSKDVAEIFDVNDISIIYRIKRAK
mgnify:CR=1 FL=1